MGRIRIAIQSVLLLAMLAGLIGVVHDLLGWTPSWWSTETTVRKFGESLTAAENTHDIRRQFERLRVHDERGITVLVESLTSHDSRIRESARLALNKQLDDWRLHNSPVTHQLIMNLLAQLEQRTKTADEAFQQSAAEFAQRLLQCPPAADEHRCQERASACQRLLLARRTLEDESASPVTDRKQSPRRLPTGDSFEDQFRLPGGLLPRR